MESLEDFFIEDNFKSGRFILSLGIKGSGKTYTMLSFLKLALKMKKYERVHLILPMFKYEQNDEYGFLKTQKHCFVYNGYNEHVSKLVEKDRLEYKTLYIIDDASSELLHSFDNTFLKLITTARHGLTGKGLTMWVCVHSCKRILAPMIRQNIDYLFVYRLSNKKLLIDIYDEFCSLKFETFNHLKHFYDEVMQEKNNGFLFTIHNDGIDGNVKNWLINVERNNYDLEPTKPIKKENKKYEGNRNTTIRSNKKHNISTRIFSKDNNKK